MARRRKTPRVRLTVRTSFNGLYKGDTATVAYDDKVRGWEAAGLVTVERVTDAPSAAEPGSAEPDDQGSEP